MIIEQEVEEEWQITSVFDFIGQFKIQDWINKKYPDSPKYCVSSQEFSSDEETIQEWLEESKDTYTMDFVDDRRNDGYWVIKRIKMPLRQYDEDDLETDLEWFARHDVEHAEAESYIMHLLGCEWSGVER